MRLIYEGPHDEVVVPAFGITAARGEPVEVEDKAQAEQLLAQGWTKAKAGQKAKEGADR